IAGPSGAHLSFYRRPSYVLSRPNNFRDRKAAIIAKIKRIARLVRRNPLEGGNVCVGQVADVDVVTDTGDVRRSIVATEDLDRWSQSHGGKQNEGDQLRFGPRPSPPPPRVARLPPH